MRYFVLSDIHGNYEGLKAVLAHVRRKRFDHVLFLGDAVGYGASPNQVMEWLRGLGKDVTIVRGNHDRACCGLDSADGFNRYAQASVTWTLSTLRDHHIKTLKELPEGPIEIEKNLAICHGSPADEDHYIFSGYDAHAGFQASEDQVVFFGHTHVQSVFTLVPNEQGVWIEVEGTKEKRSSFDIVDGRRYLINPGSVGQPRDRDPRAGYAIYDSEIKRVYLYRLRYPTKTARKRILRAGLPSVLGDRLLYGR